MLAQEQPLGLSIGALLGVPQKARADEDEEKKAAAMDAPRARKPKPPRSRKSQRSRSSASAREARRQNRHARHTSAGLQRRHSPR